MKEVLPWLALAAAAGAAVYVAGHGVGGATRSSAAITHRDAAAPTAPELPPRPVRRATAVAARSLTIRARRGDSWLEARVGSPTGALLYRALLRRGRAVRFHARTVWLLFGASQNVDVHVAGRRRRIARGTVALVLRTRR